MAKPHSVLLLICGLALGTPSLGAQEAPEEPPDRPRPLPEAADIALAARGTMTNERLGSEGASGIRTTLVPDLFTGSLRIVLPIPLPPGRNNLAPSLSLIYRSGSGEGWVGVGWDLEMGSIERAAEGGVDYTDRRFVYRSSDGVVDLAENDGFFWAEVESAFTRFEFVSHPGHSYWRATDRHGISYVLGETVSARLADPADPSRVFRWCLERVEDPFGNFIEIVYDQPVGEAPLPRAIRYTGHPELPPVNEVRFLTESLSASLETHTLGFPVLHQRRLRGIAILAADVLQSGYSLEFESSPWTGRSLLKTVRRYGRDAVVAGQAVSGPSELPPIALGYAQSPSNAPGPWSSSFVESGSSDWADVTGDGRPDWCRLVENRRVSCLVSADRGFGTEITSRGLDPGYDDSRAWVDFNGDGTADFCRVVGDPGEFRFRCLPGGPLGFGSEIDSSRVDERFHVARAWTDVNRDGKADFCRGVWLDPVEQPRQSEIYREEQIEHVSQQPMGHGSIRCRLSEGSRFASRDVASREIDLGVRSGWGWADFDGDSKLDYCRILTHPFNPGDLPSPEDGPEPAPEPGTPRGLGCLRFTGTAFGPDVEGSLAGISYGEAFGRGWVDFNGDGLAEFCRVVRAGDGERLRCTMSTGSDLIERWISPVIDAGPSAGRAWVDFNSDGFVDFCRVIGTDRRPICLAGTGRGFGPETTWPQQVVDQKWERSWVDANGDGLAEFCLQPEASGGREVRCAPPGAGWPDLVHRLDNGIGGLTTILWTSSSSFSNSFLPLALPVVAGVATNDGRGTLSETSYDYKGGYWHADQKEFRGFRAVTERGPASSGGARLVTETRFLQGNGTFDGDDDPGATEGFARGKPARVLWRDENGSLLREAASRYEPDADGSPPFFSPLREDLQRICDGGPCRAEVRTTLEHDRWGNVVREARAVQFDGFTREARSVHRTFAVNADAWILSAMVAERIYADLRPRVESDHCPAGPENDLVSCIESYFDGGSDCLVPAGSRPPVRGKLSRFVAWLPGTTGSEIRYGHGQYGELVCRMDAEGGETRYNYDSTRSLVVATTGPQDLTERWEYYGVDGRRQDGGAYGLEAAWHDVNENTTSATYDAFGRLSLFTARDGSQTTYRYELGNAQSQFVEVRQEETGLLTRTWLDGLGRTWATERTGSSGRFIRQESRFDAGGHETSRTTPFYTGDTGAAVSTWEYDALGRVTRASSPSGAQTLNCHEGWRSATVGPSGARVLAERDSAGRLLRLETFRGVHGFCALSRGTPYAVSEFQYDAMGRLAKAIDSYGFATTLEYDALGRKLSQTDANGNRWSYTYDLLGRLLDQQDPEGRVTRLRYDSASRILEKAYSQGNQTTSVRYAYDSDEPNGHGRLLSITDDSGLKVTFGYDPEGRVIREHRVDAESAYTTSFGYDGAGRLIERSFPDGTSVRYRFDGEHLAGVASGAGSSVLAAEMDAWGRPQRLRFGNGVTSTRSFCADADFRLCASEVRSAAGELLFGETYRFDRAGNIVAIFDSGNGYRWFAYDEFGRLTSAWQDFEIEDFDYDSVGNISRSTRRGAYRYSLSPSSTHPHALSGAGADSFSYDRGGSESSGPDRSFSYDAAGRPIEAEVDRKTTRLRYVGTGERRERSVAARPLWPPSAFFRTLFGRDTFLERTEYAAPEYRCDADGCARFVAADDTPLAIEDTASGTSAYLHFDGLGSLRLVTEAGGDVIRSNTFSAFGVPLQRHPNSDELRLLPTIFSGMELDEAAALYAAGGRYYDPSLGRFLAVDPAGPALASPSALNPYAYALNNPLAFSDPDGENPILIAIGIGALLGGLQAGVASDWDFDQVMRGIVIGGISGAVSYGVGSFAGPLIGGGAAGSTSALLSGGDVAKGFAFGVIGAGLAQGGTELLSDPYLGGAAGGATMAALTGENPGEAALFSVAGTAVGDWISDASGPGESLQTEMAEPVAEVGATAEPQSSPEAGFDFAKESMRLREAQRNAEVIAYDTPIQPTWSPLDFLGPTARIGGAAATAASRTLFRYRTGLLNQNRYLRVGWGKHEGRWVFRASGKVIGWFKENPHINLWRGGHY